MPRLPVSPGSALARWPSTLGTIGAVSSSSTGPTIDPEVLAMSAEPMGRHLLLMVKGVPDGDAPSRPGGAQKLMGSAGHGPSLMNGLTR